MKRFLLFALLPLMLAADDIPISWSGSGGKNTPPKVEEFTENGRTFFRCTPTDNHPWQGISAKFNAPVDLSQYRGVAFEFRQKFYPGNPAVVFYFNTPSGAVYTDFSGGNGREWQKVEIPFDVRIWKGAEKHGFPMATGFRIYPYDNLDKPSEYFEVTNVRFLPKEADNSPRKIAIRSYSISATPTDGPDPGNTLCDGKTDVDIHFRGYGNEEPVFTFDLGTIHVVTQIKLTASGTEAAQNFRNAAIMASVDGRRYFPAGSINAGSMQGNVQVYSFDTPFAARYIKISPIRQRQDFPIRIAEAEFTGYIPSSDELASFSERAYDEGRPLPPDNGSNYVSVKHGDYSFKVCKDNGILCDIRYKDQLIALKQFIRYELLYRRSDVRSDSYADNVSNFTLTENGVKYTAVNPQIPGTVFNYEITVGSSGIVSKVTVADSQVTQRAFLRIYSETIFDKDFRRDGYYESWGGHHRLERLQASEVVTDKSTDGAATMSFEAAQGKMTLFHTITHYNGIFLPPGTSVEERGVQYFLPNGMRLCIGVIGLGDNREQSISSLFLMSEGTLLDAYEKYFTTTEYADFVRNIPRAPWLRDAKIASQAGGWEGLWIGGMERATENLARLYEFDPVIVAMLPGLGKTWGDFFYGEGESEGSFGARISGRQLRERYQNLRRINPCMKVGVYNWLWSAGANSNIFANHPDWFVTKTREGAVANYFPGAEIILNYLRSFTNEASRADAVDTICGQMDAFDLDIFYLDGGTIGTFALNWETMRIDEPTSLMFMHEAIRNRMMQNNPNRAVFFNVPFNPQADFGFLESFSDIVSNWRNGAANMYKFKIFQHRNPLHYPIYIYWIGTTNGPLEDYMAGTGLFASTHSRGDKVGDVGYISARFEVRQLAMVEARILPNWRFDTQTTVEAMPLRQHQSGIIFLKHHGENAKTETVSFDAAPFGFDPDKPVYQWLVYVKDANQYECSFGEPAIRRAYEEFNWISDRVTIPQFIGTTTIVDGRISRSIELPGNRAVLYTVSQVPAVVWSYRGHPAYHRISGRPDIQISGDYDELTVTSEKENSEIAIIIPAGKVPSAITVNGENAQWNYFAENGTFLAIVKIPAAGESTVKATFTDAVAPEGKPELKLRRSGYNLRCTLTVPESYVGKALCFTISDGKNSVYGKTIVPESTSVNFTVKLPETTLDARYKVSAQLPGNEAATAFCTIRALARKTQLQDIMPPEEVHSSAESCSASANGMQVLQTFRITTENCTDSEVKPEDLSVNIRTLPQYTTYWNRAAGGFELSGVKRYIKIEMTGNLWYFNKYSSCASGRHSPRHTTPSHYLGLFFDFGTPQGYTVRATGGYGKYDIENPHILFPYGANRLPQLHWMLNDMMRSLSLEKQTLWLDLHALGAPAAWNGKLIVAAVMTHCSPDRRIGFRILETSDTLPDGESCHAPLSLQKTEPPRVVNVPRISGTPDAAVWASLPVLGTMADILNRAATEEYPAKVKIAHDGKNLYFCYLLQDEPGKIFDCRDGDAGRPYFSDSVELLLELKNRPGLQVHIIVDAKGNTVVMTHAFDPAKKSQQGKVPNFPFRKTLVTADTSNWMVVFTVPLSAIGVTGNIPGTTLSFNMMRNRVDNGIMVNFSLAPKYYSGNHHQLRLQ